MEGSLTVAEFNTNKDASAKVMESDVKMNGSTKSEKPKETKEASLLSNPLGKIEEALEKKLRNLEKRRVFF